MNKLIGRLSALILFLSTCIAAHASLAIYSYKGSSTTIGGNQTNAIAQTGTLVIDLETMSARYVGEFTAGTGKNKKSYFVNRPISNTINTQILGPKGSSYTVMATAETPGTQYTGSVLHFEVAKGVNSLLTIKTGGAPQTKWLPKVMSAPACIITQNSSVDYVTEASGTYTFNNAKTIEYNNSTKSLAEVASALESAYKAKNYTEWEAAELVGMPLPAQIPSAFMVSVQGGALPQASQLAGQRVDDFEIGRYEVTWGQWKEVRDWAVENGYGDLAGVGDTYPAGSADNFPVVDVSWYDVVKWCNAKSEKEGMTPVYKVGGAVYKTGQSALTVNAKANGYRLPTEKEWEWAARGGRSSNGYIWSGSNNAGEVAWTGDDNIEGTKPIGTKAANELGIYDMCGNVLEYCGDILSFGGYSFRQQRGGSFENESHHCAVARRDFYSLPQASDYISGFRLARNSGN